MTDTSSLPVTHLTPQPVSVTTPSLASPLPNGSLSDTNPQGEEDYTIKCTCSDTEDDGYTVYCEGCDTWQHIKCYYPGISNEDLPEVHFCNDCHPRGAEAQRPIERPKKSRDGQNGGGDRKKRPSSKVQKKRQKENSSTADQVNGWHGHDRSDSVGANRDQPPPTKKPKTSHRASGSVVSLTGTPNLSATRKRAISNVQSYPSPSKSPQDLYRFPGIPTYTPEFLELYDCDEGRDHVSVHGRSIYTQLASAKIQAWHNDPSLLASEKGRPNPEPPFIETNEILDAAYWPKVSVDFQERRDVEYDERYPKWHLLRIQTEVQKDNLVGEVRGEIGLLEEYCHPGSDNRWQDLQHPDPFVFFHPHMNIYIDSKRGGTPFRYVRRSCRPNVTLKTFVTKDPEYPYHHCFVANQNIKPGAELTAAWYLPQDLWSGEQTDTEERKKMRIRWASYLLANFGDCACDPTQNCHLAGVDHRYSPKALEMPLKQSVGRKRKTKGKHTISPLSTGQATNSRAGSEAVKMQEDDERGNRRSTSVSSRSTPRDLTPSNTVASLDADPVLGPGLSAREKRKIAAAEKMFERVEQDQHVQKKKKRISGGSNLNTPNPTSIHALGQNGGGDPVTPNTWSHSHVNYYERKHTYSKATSPSLPRASSDCQQSSQTLYRNSTSDSPPLKENISRPQYVRPLYLDAATQTDPEEEEVAQMPPAKRRKYITPTQRLLKTVLADRLKYEQQQKLAGDISMSSVSVPGNDLMEAGSSAKLQFEDVEMKDVTHAVFSSPEASLHSAASSPLPSPWSKGTDKGEGSPIIPLPSTAAHSYRPTNPPIGRRLQLNTLPPVPTFSSETSQGLSSITTPSTTTPAVSQSPFSFGLGSSSYPGLNSNMAVPSPARKKLSLGDYMSRKGNLTQTPTSEKTQAQAIDMPQDVSVSLSGNEVAKECSETTPDPTVMVRPNSAIKEEAQVMGGMEGSAIDDTVLKREPMMETVNHVSVPQSTGSQVSNAPGGQVPREVLNVLEVLKQWNPRTNSASSS